MTLRDLLLRHRVARVASEEADRTNEEAEQLLIATRWDEVAAARKALEALGATWQDEARQLAASDPDAAVRDEARRLLPPGAALPASSPAPPKPVPQPPVVGRDPRQDPRPGDVVECFDREQREVLHLWPRALAADVPACGARDGAPTTLRAGALVMSMFRHDDGWPCLVIHEASRYRLTEDAASAVALVDAPAGSPVEEVEFKTLAPNYKYAHRLATKRVRLGFWRGLARGTVIRVGPG